MRKIYIIEINIKYYRAYNFNVESLVEWFIKNHVILNHNIRGSMFVFFAKINKTVVHAIY